MICDLGIETITFNYNYEEKIKNSIDNLIRKNDIEYIELTKANKKVYETILQNIYKINGLQAGKNYQQKKQKTFKKTVDFFRLPW